MSRQMNRLGLIAAGTLLTAALVGVAAIAQNAPATDQNWQPGARFAARDTNHDGFIDKSEASQKMAARFDSIDADHDGFIDSSEMPKPGEHKNWRSGDGSSGTGR